MKQLFLSLLWLFASSVLISGCQPKLTKSIEIELTSFQADSVNEVNRADVDKAISILQKRLKDLDLFYGENQFVVDSTAINKYTIFLPEEVDEKQIARMLTAKGELGFWEVVELNECADAQVIYRNDFLRQKLQNCRLSSSPSVVGCFLIEDKETVVDTLKSIMHNKGYCLKFGIDDVDNNTAALYILKGARSIRYTNEAAMTGETITEAYVENTHGYYAVALKMNSEGAQQWAQLTENNIGKPLAVVLDGVVYSAPMVNSKIEGGFSTITGNFTKDEAKEMAASLNSGQLPLKVIIIE